MKIGGVFSVTRSAVLHRAKASFVGFGPNKFFTEPLWQYRSPIAITG